MKATDWDGLRPQNIRPIALRHARQVWRYINDLVETHGKSVFAGIVYEREPRNLEIRVQVEEILNGRFIQVAWRNPSLD